MTKTLQECSRLDEQFLSTVEQTGLETKQQEYPKANMYEQQLTNTGSSGLPSSEEGFIISYK